MRTALKIVLAAVVLLAGWLVWFVTYVRATTRTPDHTADRNPMVRDPHGMEGE